MSDLAAILMVRMRGGILIVDRRIIPAHGMIMLAILDGDFSVNRPYQRGTRVALIPETSLPAHRAARLPDVTDLVLGQVLHQEALLIMSIFFLALRLPLYVC